MALGFGFCFSIPAGTYNNAMLGLIIFVFAAAIVAALVAGFFGLPPIRTRVMKSQHRQTEDLDVIGLE
jgi:hypothetical protein